MWSGQSQAHNFPSTKQKQGNGDTSSNQSPGSSSTSESLKQHNLMLLSCYYNLMSMPMSEWQPKSEQICELIHNLQRAGESNAKMKELQTKVLSLMELQSVEEAATHYAPVEELPPPLFEFPDTEEEMQEILNEAHAKDLTASKSNSNKS